MIYIGCHLSVTNGYEAMGRQMVDLEETHLHGLQEIHVVEKQRI